MQSCGKSCVTSGLCLWVCRSSAVPERTANISAAFFLLSLSSVPKDIAVTIAALRSSKNKLPKQPGLQQVFCYGFLKTKNTTWMPRDRDLQGWPCVLGHLGWRWQGAPPSLAAGWGSACGTWRQCPCPQRCRRQGERRGLLAALGPPEAVRLSRGCEALQSSPVLSVRARITDLEPAAWLGVCCWLFCMRRVVLAGLHAVIRH